MKIILVTIMVIAVIGPVISVVINIYDVFFVVQRKQSGYVVTSIPSK